MGTRNISEAVAEQKEHQDMLLLEGMDDGLDWNWSARHLLGQCSTVDFANSSVLMISDRFVNLSNTRQISGARLLLARS